MTLSENTARDERPSLPITFLVMIGVVALVGTMFRTTFVDLWTLWRVDPCYPLGPLVPLASVGLAIAAWRRDGGPVLREVDRTTCCYGGMLLAWGALLHVGAGYVCQPMLDVWSLVLVLNGLLMVLGGKAAQRRFMFATGYLILMAPWPMAIYQNLVQQLQHDVSAIAAFVLEACHVPLARIGYLIHLQGFTIEVDASLCGMWQLSAALAVAVLLGYLARRGRWFIVLAGTLSLPIVVVLNVVVVALCGACASHWGPVGGHRVLFALNSFVLNLAAVMLVVVAVRKLGQFIDWIVRTARASRPMWLALIADLKGSPR